MIEATLRKTMLEHRSEFDLTELQKILANSDN